MIYAPEHRHKRFVIFVLTFRERCDGALFRGDMTDEEAATKVSPEELAAYWHVESLEIGLIGPYGSSMYYESQVRDAFLAGVEYGENKILKRVEVVCKPTRRKPEHGPCCTCQTCGFCHDDCECENNHLRNIILCEVKKEPS